MTSTSVLKDASLKRNPLEPSGKSYRLFSGSPHPFGSTVEREGVNFSLYSSTATSVKLLIFDKPDDLNPLIEIDLSNVENRSFNIWHVFVEGVKPGMGYANRVDGPHEPRNGHRFDPDKVLLP